MNKGIGTGINSTPKIQQIVLTLTGACNFCCRYCYASQQEPAAMSVETALAAVNLAAAQNKGQPFILQFSGGEPLLNWPILQAVVEQVRQQGLPVQMQLQTNGSLLDLEKARFLYDNVVGIGISLDGTPAVNDTLRLVKQGGSSTMAALKGIGCLKDLGIGCGLTCVVSAANVQQLPQLLEFAYYLGNVRRLGFDLLRPQGRGSQLQPAAASQVRRAMEQVVQRNEALARLCGYKIELTQVRKAVCSSSFAHCSAITGQALFVTPSGGLYGCASYMGQQEFCLGNLADAPAEIFQNASYNTSCNTANAAENAPYDTLDNTTDNVRAYLLSLQAKQQQVAARLRFLLQQCHSCTKLSSCGGGCAARWEQHQAWEECALKEISGLAAKINA